MISKKPQLRAIQYFYADGSFEFGFGLLCLILAAFFYAETHVQGWLSALVDGSLVLVMIGGAWLRNRLIKMLKERLTWPRTGYVRYSRQAGRKRGWRFALGMGIGELVALLFLNRSKFPAQSQDQAIYLNLGLLGFLFSGILAIIGWKIPLPRYYLIAAAVFLTSTVFLVSGSGGNLGLALLSGAMSLILFTSGGVTLWRYLRNTRSFQDGQSAE